ncbi:hypothetical protein A374_07454 [Fictibacillus macauensis ZFHKF-1]|uniref:Uncharacterized protein n=1 Tax=Fictibacillus macauensis ZFHKF-1 TaxID=1196324 RepID=I8AJG4_9BACL|nr:hypothetical protein [Fictibacillus macauensis]EIT85654.1 hypothetical protein A374_07454 [Fictibacillus macauensis ZFHKF-1]
MKKSEQIANRESWLKVIVIAAVVLLLLYKIAVSSFVFRFSDFISLFASLFAVAVSLMYYRKYKELLVLMTEVKDQLAQSEQEPSKRSVVSSNEEQTQKNDLFEGIDPTVTFTPSAKEMETIRLQEEELRQIEMDKTQIFQQLYTRDDLNEEEKKFFEQQIEEKEKRASKLKQDMIQFGAKISQAITKTPQLFQKRDAKLEGIVRAMTPEVVETASLQEINERLDQMRNNIPLETLQALYREGYLDEEYHLTRAGYREVIHVSKLL